MSEMSCFKNEKGDSCCAHNSIGENVFETLPSYILNSKKYALEFENVHRQGFFQRNIVADLLITKGNHFFNAGLMEEAIVYLEKVYQTIAH